GRRANRFDCGAIVPLDHGKREQRDDVITKVPGHGADAEAPLRVPRVPEWIESLWMGLLDALPERRVPREQRVLRNLPGTVEREELGRLEIEIVGEPLTGHAVERERLVR